MKRKPKPKPDFLDRYIGCQLFFIRQIKGISQQELGRRVGISFQQIQKYEQGMNRISASRLFHLAKALEVDLVDFFHGYDSNKIQFHEGLNFKSMEDKDLMFLLKNWYHINDNNFKISIKNLIKGFADSRTN